MAIGIIAHTSAGASSPGTSVTTSAVDTTGASFIGVVVADLGNATVTSLTDSKGNTWTARTAYPVTNSRTRIYYCANPTVGTGHTFTATSTSGTSFPALAIIALSVTDTSAPYDVENGNAAVNVANIAPGSITPSANNEIVIAGMSTVTAQSGLSVNGGFTLLENVAFLSSNHVSCQLAYLIQTTAAAANPTFSWTLSSANSSVAIASFKAASGGGGSLIKTINGLAKASVKTRNGLAIASAKTLNGLA